MNARRFVAHAVVVLAMLVSASAPAEPTGPARAEQRLIRVGPGQSVTRIGEAAKLARDGDTIEIEAGDYVGDVAVWDRSNLTIRGVGGTPRIIAGGANAEGKGIWVVRGGDTLVQNLAFIGAHVRDRNGAGIRHEKGRLKVVDCLFKDNENGILTGNDHDSELEIERSEFAYNGAGDGQSHNLYVGSIRSLKVTDSYFHHAKVGHLLKSRAQQNYIAYNRLTDETGGRASYELELPSGGLAYVIGNIIQQGSQTENSTVISFGAEGYRWPRNELYLINNTLVDDRPQGGVFLHVKPGADRIKAVNNLLLGKSRLESAGPGEYAANFDAQWSDVALAVRQDYRLKKSSKLVGKAVDPGEANGIRLRPDREYVHPRHSRLLGHGPLSPGALQSPAP